MENIIAWHKVTGPIDDFNSIISDGEIKPRGSMKMAPHTFTEYWDFKHKIQKNPLVGSLDLLAGDANKVFLSLNPLSSARYLPERFIGEPIFGKNYRAFGFPADELIKHGATIGTKDLLSEYRNALTEIILEALEDRLQGINRQEHNDITRSIMGIDPEIASLFLDEYGLKKDFNEEIKNIKNKYRFKGKRAWNYILSLWRKCKDHVTENASGYYDEEEMLYCGSRSDFGRIEILYPGSLPLTFAEYVIFNGSIYPSDILEELDG